MAASALVALLCDRTVETVAAMLGIWKAGCALLPLDVRQPAARLEQIVRSAEPACLLQSCDTSANLSETGLPAQDVSAWMATSAAYVLPSFATRNDLAYVIYTSGSTGTPKGVAVSHGSTLHLFEQTAPTFSFTPEDVWTLFHSPGFDVSVWEIWGCLLTGGRLVLVPYETSRQPLQFAALLASEAVTVLSQTPSALQLLIEAETAQPRPLPHLRLVLLAGEALRPHILRPWFALHLDGAPAVINLYGITETTVHSTIRRMRPHDAEGEAESVIGDSIPGLQLHILDEALQPCSEGELYVGGPGVAMGYWRQPRLTAERFLPNPFGPGRLYRSGDLARRRADGELVYLGRADRQVKINGHRVELAEIEAALLQHPEVRQVCVDFQAASGLTAYLVRNAQSSSQSSDWKGFLQNRLPAHAADPLCGVRHHAAHSKRQARPHGPATEGPGKRFACFRRGPGTELRIRGTLHAGSRGRPLGRGAAIPCADSAGAELL